MNNTWNRAPMPAKATLSEWASVLRYFRYHRHYGGHSDIEDELVMALRPSALSTAAKEDVEALIRSRGQSARFHSFDDRILIAITDSHRLFVTQESVQAAIAVESMLADSANMVIDPPIDSPNCYSRKYHPELWGPHA